MKQIKKCRICNSSSFSVLMSYDRFNADGVYALKETDKKAFVKKSITLLRCNECGFIQLKEIINSKIYEDYNFASQNSDDILEWIKKISNKLIRDFEIKGKNILEVGSGDGSFAKHFIKNNTVLAIEPSEKLALKSNLDGIPTINKFFNEKLTLKFNKKFKWIFVRHVLEHINDLREFSKQLNNCLEENGYLYLEQPYAPCIIKSKNYFNIFYEHINYFRIKDIKKLFAIYGFKIIEYGFNKINNGSFYVILSRNKKYTKEQNLNLEISKSDYSDFIKEFNYLKRHISTIKDALINKSFCGYGAANKTFSILSLGNFKQGELIEVYDKNVNLHNKYIPYFNYKIVKPEKIKQTKPEAILIFATSYQKEIINYLSELKYHGKVVTIFPSFNILDL